MTGGCMDEIAFVYITRHVTDSNRSGCIISDGIDEVQYDLYNITSCYWSFVAVSCWAMRSFTVSPAELLILRG